MRRVFRRVVAAYLIVSVAMIVTSFVTGRRATRISGHEHYMLTTTRVFVEEQVAAENARDAAFDAAFQDAGESTTLLVAKPIFVLGFFDATGPFVIGGGLALGVAAWRRRRRLGSARESTGH